jgi:hypothetical protein
MIQCRAQYLNSATRGKLGRDAFLPIERNGAAAQTLRRSAITGFKTQKIDHESLNNILQAYDAWQIETIATNEDDIMIVNIHTVAPSGGGSV